LEPRLEELKQAVKAEAERRPEAGELMKQKGIGPVIAVAYILTIGPVERFPNRCALVRYLGLNPGEQSSGGR
jgi:transposase